VLRLSGADGSFFDMDIAGYQFPADLESPLPEYDLNWLQVHIHARDADGHEWEATDPCLLTWELAGLSKWFRKHAQKEPESSTAYSLEPCLWFAIVGNTLGNQATDLLPILLDVHLGYELGQKVVDLDNEAHQEACLQFRLSLDELSQIAKCWAMLSRDHPLRQ
jgi:hypothetical protein